ncbi:hypothetical protein [Arenibaculum pallidiluteum]|uniref:hypothetical protein n=1 Tax=Arenibaculum pallidiluteum TaxID=2812559 RepID=UPI001A962251|nr:hypothetical protein [Arenibaculum pallidiluteum]
MANRGDAHDLDSSALSRWLLNPAAIIFAVCILLVLAIAGPDERQSLLVVVVVALIAFVAGRLSRNDEAHPGAAE